MRKLLKHPCLAGFFILIGSLIQPVYAQFPPLIETEEVARLLRKPDVVVIDSRDKEEYDKAHIPGAVNIPKGTFREPEDIAYKSKHGFLTSPEKAEKVFGNAGIGENARVIVYGSNNFPSASICLVILKQYGFDNVQVMKGEIEKWVLENRPLTKDVPAVKPKTLKAKPRPEMVATRDWITENSDRIVLLDMRSFEEYTGTDMIGNPRGGHISGAYPTEWKELAGTVTVRSPDEMLKALRNSGVPIDKNKEYITYCNWGIGRGTSGFLYLKVLGFDKVRVYGGSMEEWSKHKDMPVSTYEVGSLD